MGNSCCKKKLKRNIVLLLVGLDNAGKTAAAKGLAGESPDTIVPTVGFSVINLKYSNYDVKIFDLGGRQDIRGIWDRYFVDAHGVIFVVDASDYSRLDEAQIVFKELVTHEKVAGKPILILANKQDSEDALDEIDLVEKLRIEALVNSVQCPAMVESCSAVVNDKKSKLDHGILTGYRWLLNYIIKQYKELNERVKNDVEVQEKINHQNRLKIIERLKQLDYKDKTEANNEITRVESPNLGQFLVDTKTAIKNNSDTSLQSDVSFPHVYNENLEDLRQQTVERPKSAVAAVRQQLEKSSVQKNPSAMSFLSSKTNKTSPALIFDVHRPSSASSATRSEPRTLTITEVKPRPPKSAGDSINHVSEWPKTERHGPNGDNRDNDKTDEFIILRDLNGLNSAPKHRLPPIIVHSEHNSKNSTELSMQVNKSFSPDRTNSHISTIDID